ncbi:MAG: hypothetical protein ACLFU9_04420 [Candidatus Bathyarchaeia archaeon]
MSVFEKITREIRAGETLRTPVRNAPFTIDSINTKHVVFFVGAKTKIKIPRACWDGIPNFLKGKDWVKIGARHDIAPNGTFEEYLDQYWSEGKSMHLELHTLCLCLSVLKLLKLTTEYHQKSN